MRLLQIKQRPIAKGLILVAADFGQIEPYIQPLSAKQRQILEATWPGAVTWLIPTATAVPKWLTGEHASIALRITNHPTTAALCKRCGHALVSTSANPTTHKAAKTALTVRRYFQSQLDFILNAPLGSTEKPTEIRELISGQIVRPG